MNYLNQFRETYHYGRYKIVKELIKDKGKDLLDIGCGPPSDSMKHGAFLRYMGYGTGLDIEKRTIPFKFVLGNMEKMPFKDKSFSVVSAQEVIEHVHDPNKALDEVARVLKDDGVAIVTTPNNHIPFQVFWWCWERFIGGQWAHTHIYSFDKKGWLNFIRKNGNFKITYLKNYWKGNLIMRLEKLEKIKGKKLTKVKKKSKKKKQKRAKK